jgi:hypothetical protein
VLDPELHGVGLYVKTRPAPPPPPPLLLLLLCELLLLLPLLPVLLPRERVLQQVRQQPAGLARK